MYDLTNFTLQDMTTCSAVLRKLGRQATSMEDVANRVVHYLYDHLRVPLTDDRACGLIRLYKTHPYGELNAPLQAFATTLLSAESLAPTTPCLSLLATAGARPEWNSRRHSHGYQAIPLQSPAMVATLPMIAQLIAQFGIEVATVLQPASLVLDLEQKSYNVFYVPEAVGSPYIPAQETFVIPHGITSVLGCGGLLPGGHLFALILFSQVFIPPQTAELFRVLALSIKMALLSCANRAVFADDSTPPDSADQYATTAGSAPDAVRQLHSHITALDELLEVHEQTTRIQTEKLRCEISERRRTEEALQQAHKKTEEAQLALQAEHQRTAHLLATIPSILIGLDEAMRVSWWNSTAVQVLGLSLSEVLGQALADCPIAWDWPALQHGLAVCQTTGQPTQVDEVSFELADGTKGFLGLSIAPMARRLDRTLCFLIMGTDITARKMLESQLVRAQKLESIGQLAAGIAHEINTPIQYVGDNTHFLQDAFNDLTVLLDQATALQQASHAGSVPPAFFRTLEGIVAGLDVAYLTEEIPRALQQSLEGIERITMIVQAMKDFSHPGTGHKTLLDLNQAIKSTIIVARNEWKYVADIVTDLEPGLPLVPCLPGELNQVVLNLIINAAHAIADMIKTEATVKGTITLSTRQEGDGVTIRVTDTGTGIPTAIRDRIFDPFFTTKAVGQGTGQGLAMAHNVVVQKHGGTITLDTVEGHGTTFIIHLPLTETAHARSTSTMP